MDTIFTYLNFYSLPKINLSDIVEILIISTMLYTILKTLKDSRAIVITRGLVVLAVAYLAALVMEFNVITTLFQWGMIVCAFVLLIVFQPEIRRLLEGVGNKHLSLGINKIKTIMDPESKKYISTFYNAKTIEEIAIAIKEMSKVNTGAIIVLERNIPLSDYIGTGIEIDAKIDSSLIVNIFEKNTPLHDGALIVKNNRLHSAACILPLTNNTGINKKFGTRHRAGIGISESTDAVVVIVSEETGKITYISNDGRYAHGITIEKLKELLKKHSVIEVLDETFKDKINRINPRRNGLLKIASFILTIIFWIIMINVNDPYTTKNFTVPITIINDTTLYDLGQTYSIDGNKTVTVTVTGRRSYLDYVTTDDIVVNADIKYISITNSVPLDVDMTNEAYFDISLNSNSIILQLEELVEIETQITINNIGSIDKNSYLLSQEMSSKTVVVSLPLSVSGTLDTVEVDVYFNDDNTSFTSDYNIVIHDKNGDVLTEASANVDYITILNNIIPKKEVDVNVTIDQSLFEKYEILSYESDTSSIEIAGSQSVLDGIETIELIIDSELSDDTNTVIKQNEIIIPSDVYLVSDISVINTTIKLDNIQSLGISFSLDDVSIYNKNEDLEYEVSISQNLDGVEISGKKELLSGFDNELIYIDVEEILEPGEYNMTVQINDDNISFTTPIIASVVVSNIEEK